MVISSVATWGLFTRLLGLVYLVFFFSLRPQARALNKIYPVGDLLGRARKDIGSPRCYFFFPTLSWLLPTGAALEAFCFLGCLFSALVIVGGFLSPLWLFFCWLLALSLVTSQGEFVGFVWDRLLLETGFLALFLPPLLWLPRLASQAPAAPVLKFAFCWLLFRVMFGMGKFKFLGRWWEQPLYLKWFQSFQPLPSTAAYYMFRLPDWFHKLSLYVMFVAEMVLPFLLFFKPSVAVWAVLSTFALQVGIWVTGNFGVFNVLTMVLCLPPLASSEPAKLSLLGIILVFIAMAGGLVYLPYNTWVTNIWMYSLAYKSRLWSSLKPLLDFYRFLSPFHLANAYGIFEAQEEHDPDLPSVEYRRVLVIEGSHDGHSWQEYEYKYQTCRPDVPPKHFAPHQPRIDHNLYYEAFNVRFSNINMQNPYYFGQFTWLDRLLQCLLRGDEDVLALFARNPFSDTPPKYVRVLRYNVRFTTAHERADTGNWWVRELYETKIGVTAKRDDVFDLPQPNEFAKHHTWWRSFLGLRPPLIKVRKDWIEITEARPPGRMTVGDRELIRREGYWWDASLTPEVEIFDIQSQSQAHQKLLQMLPELRHFSHLRWVVLVFGEVALRFGDGGKTIMTRSGLKKLRDRMEMAG